VDAVDADEVVAEEVAKAMTLEGYLRALEATFSPERARGKRVVLQYVFTGRQEGDCFAIVEDGTIAVALGRHPAPTATVTSDFDLWRRVMAYHEDALLAYQAGQFQVAGDVEALMEADAWFVRPVAH
jgi:hypothetical protein